MRDALERETSGSILDPSKSIDRNRTRHRQHDGGQHCAPQNSLSNPNPGLRQRNDFRAEDKVNSSAQAKNNGVHDKPVLVSAGWLDLFAELLAQQAELETGILSRAFRRAARSAFLWPEEVSNMVVQNRSPTELRSV